MIARFHWRKWWNHMEVVHHLINYYILIHIPMEWEKWSSTVVIQKYGPNLSWEPGFWSVLVLYLENNLPGLQGLGWDFQPSEEIELSTSVSTGTVFGIHCLWGVRRPQTTNELRTKKKAVGPRLEFGGVKPTNKKTLKNGFDIVCLILFFLVPWMESNQESEMNCW